MNQSRRPRRVILNLSVRREQGEAVLSPAHWPGRCGCPNRGVRYPVQSQFPDVIKAATPGFRPRRQ